MSKRAAVSGAVFAAGLWALSGGAAAQDLGAVDENALFGDTSMIVDSSTIVNNEAVRETAIEKTTVGFSGEIVGSEILSLQRNWFVEKTRFDREYSGLHSSMVGTGYLDVRVPGAIKAFAAMDARVSTDSGAAVDLSELFVDANVKKRVYVRVGKQVLQWGRCYFFNPTDLINVEKKTFLLRLGPREGASGVKFHVPFGTRLNLYGFLDTRNALRPDSVAGAAKVEVLLGGTEMAVSVWDRKGAVPVYGYDISATLWDFILAGEMSLSYGDNLKRLVVRNGVLDVAEAPEKWIPRVSAGFTRFFNVNGLVDRLMVVGEFYYNSGGYDKSVFRDSTIYPYRSPVTLPFSGSLSLTEGQKAIFFVLNDLYEPNNYGRYYAAIFSSFSRFIVKEMTLTGNAISNMSEGSFILTGGLTYTSLHDFSVSLNVNAFLGRGVTEYTLPLNEQVARPAMSAQLTAGILF